ncbi:MAG: hypothetical protein J5851_00715 [Oscillospiraceae bacterium]|nr:hypothetical protein [Oscillospiraceae bacterium]
MRSRQFLSAVTALAMLAMQSPVCIRAEAAHTFAETSAVLTTDSADEADETASDPGYTVTLPALSEITIRPNETITYTLKLKTTAEGATFRLVQNGSEKEPPVGIGMRVSADTEAIYSQLRWEVTEISDDATELVMEIVLTGKDYGICEVPLDLDTEQAGADRHFIVLVDADGTETPVAKIDVGSVEITVDGDPLDTSDPEVIYQDILAFYRENISGNWEAYTGSREGTVMNSRPSDVSDAWFTYASGITLHEAGYLFHDINGDDIPELFVGVLDRTDAFFFDMYTSYEGRIVHLVSSGKVNDGTGSGLEYWCQIGEQEVIIRADGMDDTGALYCFLEKGALVENESDEGHTMLSLPYTPFETGNALGDMNGDAIVNASDSALILIAAASIGAGEDPGLTTSQMTAADINKDDNINASDAAIVLIYAAAVGAGDSDAVIGDFVRTT